jgi:hypothetical protein
LKIIQNLRFILRVNEICERHVVHDLDVVNLVRLDSCGWISLDLQDRPAVSPEDQDVRDTLKVVGVVPEDDTAREHPPEFLDKVGLEYAFSGHAPLQGKIQENVISISSFSDPFY